MESTNRCRCNRVFCNMHKMPDTHVCTVDLKELNKKNLEKRLVQVVSQKVDPI